MKKSTRKPRAKKPRMKSIMHFFENNPPKNPVVAEMRSVFVDKCAKSPMLMIPRTYLLAFGDLHTTAFVQHIAYLMERSADDHGWTYHSNWHVCQELCITEDRLGDIKVELEAKGLLKTFYDRRLHRFNYCLVPGAIRNLIDSKGIVTGNEEIDLGVKKPKFLQKGGHSAETGVERRREFSLKKTNPLGFQENHAETSGFASGHAVSSSETQPTAEPSSEPSCAPEAQAMTQATEGGVDNPQAPTRTPASGTGSDRAVTPETVNPAGAPPVPSPSAATNH